MSGSSLFRRWQAQLAAVKDPLLAGACPDPARLGGGDVRGTEIERYREPTPFPLER